MKTYTLPTLYALSSKGKTKHWTIGVEEQQIAGGFELGAITTSWGYTDAEEQRSLKLVSKGKNIGKSNETTPYEQAVSDATSAWNKKKDKGYAEVLGEQAAIPRPMLAHSYGKRNKDIEFPCYVQPKLNGVRCLATREGDNVSYLSRGGKAYTTLGHLTPSLLEAMEDGETWDGEVFTTDLTFQGICAAVKKQSEDSLKLEYWVYDVVEDDEPFQERITRLIPLALEQYDGLVGVYTDLCENKEKLLYCHGLFTEQGYEGTIIRNLNGTYKQGHRSKDLQKHKDFLDSEFQIVGAKEGTGKDAGTVIWRCITDDGSEFDVRPRGTHYQRSLWWDFRDNYKGQLLTVRYQNLSDDGIPIFPVGLGMRDYE